MQRELDLEEIKSIQLNILSQVAEFCDKNGLRYFLAYGTLLGAVRHKGYIPWDDDIDIMMPRPDYMKFVNSFQDNAGHLKVVAYNLDSHYPYLIAKVYDAFTVCKERVAFKYQMGINIDIFPIDGLPEDLTKFRVYFKKLSFWRKVYTLKTVALSSKRNLLKNVLLLIGKCFFSWISLGKVIRSMDSYVSSISYDTATYAGSIVFGGGAKERMSKFIFSNVDSLEFEGKRYYVPIGYKVWLKNIYGNYMELPPVEQRVTHHDYIAYKLDE